jgi:hypothetical protein
MQYHKMGISGRFGRNPVALANAAQCPKRIKSADREASGGESDGAGPGKLNEWPVSGTAVTSLDDVHGEGFRAPSGVRKPPKYEPAGRLR